MESDEIKEKMAPLYSELQGYLSQTPLPDYTGEEMGDEDVWVQYNNTVQSLG